MTEVDAIKQDFRDFREEAHQKFNGLTEVMRDQIKMDGLIQQQADIVKRMVVVLDDLEKRMRTLETSNAVHAKSVGRWDMVIDRILLGVIAVGMVALGMKS